MFGKKRRANSRLVAGVAAFAAAIVLAGAAGADDRALVVGVNESGSDKFPRLKYCEADAEDLASCLGQSNFNVKVMTRSRADRGAGRFPDRAGILDELGIACDNTTGTLIVFLSGHGISLDSTDGGRAGGFLAADARWDGGKGGYLNLVMVEREVLARMENSAASRKILFVDACRETNNRGHDPPIDIPADDRVTTSKTHVIYSCTVPQVSKEDDKLQHGVFTHFLLKGLKGYAATDPRAKFVTIAELSTYLEQRVKAHSKILGVDQIPQWKKPDNEPVNVLEFEQPGSRSAVVGNGVFDLPGDLPDRRARLDDFKDSTDIVGVTFIGKFSSDVFANKRFVNCKFKNCKFTKSVNMARVEFVDCKFDDANFTQARNTEDATIIGDPPGNLQLIFGDDKPPALSGN